jgi:D-tyrosyl-tRNA(Tyr) deacylase
MRALLQRVSAASVAVEDEEIARIGRGWVILLGVGHGDDEANSAALAEKVVLLRCFEDEHGKTNRAAADVAAEFLVVSQFTLYADTARGRRPGFTGAAPPALASRLVSHFAAQVGERGFRVATGRFGTHMRLSLVNDGPFTIWLDTAGAAGTAATAAPALPNPLEQ